MVVMYSWVTFAVQKKKKEGRKEERRNEGRKEGKKEGRLRIRHICA